MVGKMFVKFASDVYDLYNGDDNAAKAVCIMQLVAHSLSSRTLLRHFCEVWGSYD